MHESIHAYIIVMLFIVYTIKITKSNIEFFRFYSCDFVKHNQLLMHLVSGGSIFQAEDLKHIHFIFCLDSKNPEDEVNQTCTFIYDLARGTLTIILTCAKLHSRLPPSPKLLLTRSCR